MGSIQSRSPQTQISLFITFRPKYTSQKIGLGRSGMVESHGVCNVGFWICYYEPSQTKSPFLRWQRTQVAHLPWWPKYELSREIKWDLISTECGGKHSFTWNLSRPHWRDPQSQRKSRNCTLGAKIQPALSLDFGYHDECGFLERVILIPSFISDWHWRMCLHNSQYVSDSECRDFIPKDFILICCCSSGFEASHKSLPTDFLQIKAREIFIIFMYIF